MFTTKQLFFLAVILNMLMQNVVLAHDKSEKILAKKIFGNFTSPANLSSESVGSYNKGCLNGGIILPFYFCGFLCGDYLD